MQIPHVAELVGQFGPVQFPEELVQRIWWEQDFADDGLRLEDGRALRIRRPGRWNLLGGPDFRGAELEIGGLPVVGDVEVHFRASDWAAHGHNHDPAYEGVVLHVLLWPPRPNELRARTATGRDLAELVLLPRLRQDLESYLLETMLRRQEGRDLADRLQSWMRLDLEERERRLVSLGCERWQRRRYWTAERLRTVGWAETCHQRLFEVLGYAANRSPLVSLAWRHPWEQWRYGHGPDPERWWEEERERWRGQGLRPANHPRVRLAQLRAIWECARDWPAALREVGGRLPAGDGPPAEIRRWRRQVKLPYLRQELAGVLGGVLAGPRLDTWITEAALPLLAAATGRELGTLWWAWLPGDRPRGWGEVLRLLGPPPAGGPSPHGRWQAAGTLADLT